METQEQRTVHMWCGVAPTKEARSKGERKEAVTDALKRAVAPTKDIVGEIDF